MVRGYEYAKDQYVVLTAEEIGRSSRRATSRSRSRSSSRSAGRSDLLREDLPPRPRQGRPEGVPAAREAMPRPGKGAVAKFSTRGRQQLVLLRGRGRPHDARPLLRRRGARLRRDRLRRGRDAQAGRARAGGAAHRAARAPNFEPTKYEDEYRKRVLQLIEQKVAGQEIVAGAGASAEGADHRPDGRAEGEPATRKAKPEAEPADAARSGRWREGRRSAKGGAAPERPPRRRRLRSASDAGPVSHRRGLARARRLRRAASARLVRAGCAGPRAGRAFTFSFQDLVVLRPRTGSSLARVPPRRVRRALTATATPSYPPTGRCRACASPRKRGRVVVRDRDSAWQPESGQLVLDFAVDELARTGAAAALRAAPQEPRRRRRRRPATGSSAASRSRTRTPRPRAPPISARSPSTRAGRRLRQPRPHRARGRRRAHGGALLPSGARARRDDPVVHFNLALALEDLRRGSEAARPLPPRGRPRSGLRRRALQPQPAARPARAEGGVVAASGALSAAGSPQVIATPASRRTSTGSARSPDSVHVGGDARRIHGHGLGQRIGGEQRQNGEDQRASSSASPRLRASNAKKATSRRRLSAEARTRMKRRLARSRAMRRGRHSRT